MLNTRHSVVEGFANISLVDDQTVTNNEDLNWIGMLQDRAVKCGYGISYVYTLSGPKHMLVHQAECICNNTHKSIGVGSTKKAAKTNAARKMLLLLDQGDDCELFPIQNTNSGNDVCVETTIDYVTILQVIGIPNTSSLIHFILY